MSMCLIFIVLCLCESWIYLPCTHKHLQRLKSVSHSVISSSATPWLEPARLLRPWNSPGYTGVGNHLFSSRSSQPRDWTQVFCTAGRFFTIWATREAPICRVHHVKCQAGWSTSWIQDWFPLGLTGLISLLSKGLSRVPALQFKSINSLVLSLWSNSHIHTYLLEKPETLLRGKK